MNTITVSCGYCGNPVEKLQKEINRSKKRGTGMFCDHSCACSYGLKVSPRKGNPEYLNASNRLDGFSPFKYFVSKAKSKQRVDSYGETDLTLEYLKSIWESQNKRCPYTNKEMFLPPTTKHHNYKALPNQASLDRIDSSKGYVQGNVEFVCYAINLAKNSFSRDDMMAFFAKS